MKFTIKVPPRTKKNHSQICKSGNRYFLRPSKQYLAYEAAAGKYITDLIRTQAIGMQLPVNVKATFYMDTLRRVDLVNLEQALLDILVKYKVLLDDNNTVVASMDGSRVMYDKENPRTVVEITEYTPERRGRR